MASAARVFGHLLLPQFMAMVRQPYVRGTCVFIGRYMLFFHADDGPSSSHPPPRRTRERRRSPPPDMSGRASTARGQQQAVGAPQSDPFAAFRTYQQGAMAHAAGLGRGAFASGLRPDLSWRPNEASMMPALSRGTLHSCLGVSNMLSRR